MDFQVVVIIIFIFTLIAIIKCCNSHPCVFMFEWVYKYFWIIESIYWVESQFNISLGNDYETNQRIYDSYFTNTKAHTYVSRQWKYETALEIINDRLQDNIVYFESTTELNEIAKANHMSTQ